VPVITTEGIPRGERFEFWRETIRDTSLEFRMQPVPEAPHEGNIRVERIGGLDMMKFDGAVVTRYSRTRTEISRSQRPQYFVQIQLRGYCLLERGEEQSALSVGDGFLGDPLREFEMMFGTADHRGKCSLVVAFPKESLAGRVARPDRLSFSVLRHDRPMTRLLTSYLVNGIEVAGEITPDAAVLFEEHAVELLTQALRESWAEEPQPSDACREALFVRACRLIKLRYADPGLGPEPLAGELHISTRLLQRIFAERGETVMKRIFAERVTRAAKLLQAPEAARRSVTDIAFSCGFNDSSHFGRVFAAQMDATPTAWRREGRLTGR